MIDNHAMIDHDFGDRSNQNPLKGERELSIFVFTTFDKLFNIYLLSYKTWEGELYDKY